MSEVAKFDLSIPLACVRFFIFLILVKQDIEATYHADLRWLELEDVVEVQGETGSGIGLNGWRYSGRDWEDEANGGEDEDFGSEGDKQCPDGEEIGTGDVDEEEVTVQYQRENEESLGLPSAGNEEEGTEEVPFVRRLADLVMQMEFPPHPNALYNKYIIDRGKYIYHIIHILFSTL